MASTESFQRYLFTEHLKMAASAVTNLVGLLSWGLMLTVFEAVFKDILSFWVKPEPP